MNPNDPNIPKTPSENNASYENNSNMAPRNPKEDELFIINPPEKKPLDKKSVILVATLSIIGIILLVVVAIFALIGSATNLANDYRRLAALQINKIEAPLNDLEPNAVLDRRNLEAPGKKIDQSEQSLPSLANVLFVGAWSERYTQTAVLEKKIQIHYQNIHSYQNDLKSLLTFDNSLRSIIDQEPAVTATANPRNSLSIRSVSGSYENYAKEIEKQNAPPQLENLKKQLVEIYHNKATIYINWATQVESGNITYEPKATSDLLIESGKAVTLIEDQSFVGLISPSYTKLINDQKVIERQLAN